MQLAVSRLLLSTPPLATSSATSIITTGASLLWAAMWNPSNRIGTLARSSSVCPTRCTTAMDDDDDSSEVMLDFASTTSLGHPPILQTGSLAPGLHSTRPNNRTQSKVVGESVDAVTSPRPGKSSMTTGRSWSAWRILDLEAGVAVDQPCTGTARAG